jgi:hypothetical protein
VPEKREVLGPLGIEGAKLTRGQAVQSGGNPTPVRPTLAAAVEEGRVGGKSLALEEMLEVRLALHLQFVLPRP